MTQRPVFWLGVAISLTSFLLYRPYSMQQSGLLYGGDDYNYLAHATALAYGTFPDYSKEAYAAWPMRHAWGSGLMASPFVFAFSQIDRAQHRDIVHQRSSANVPGSWTAFGFVFATQFYFLSAVLLLILLTTRVYSSLFPVATIILCGLSSGLGLYVYRRPVFSHAYEFFAVCSALYLLARVVTQPDRRAAAWEWIAMTTACCSIYLVRYNNAILGGAFLMAFAWTQYSDRRSFPWKTVLASVGLYCSVAMLSHHLTDTVIRMGPSILRDTPASHEAAAAGRYWQDVWHFLFDSRGFTFYRQRLIHVFFGWDWGLIYTAPLALAGLAGFRFIPRSRYYLLPLVSIGFNLYMCLRWGTQGSWYGYRYLLFVLLPFSIMGFSFLIDRLTAGGQRWPLWLATTISVIPFASVLAFEGNATTLTLALGHTRWDSGYINNTYQLEVWKTLATHPASFIVAAAKGGPIYLAYLLAQLMGKAAALPADVISRYPIFSLSVLAKSVILWICPLLTGVLFLRWTGKHDRP